MILPLIEAAWCQYLDGSTRADYPMAPGDIRVTLISSNRLSRVTYQVSVLVELWATPATSDADAVELHSKVLRADSNPALTTAYFTDVRADVPVQNDDPDSDLDRYQFLVAHTTRML